LPTRVDRRCSRARSAVVLVLTAASLGGCSGGIEAGEDGSADHRTAALFLERCSGCHTLQAADAQGSAGAGNFASRDRTNGPNFDTRHVDARDALYAIRNGGFSGTIMPANIVTGRQAELMARFLDRYSGRGGGGDDVLDSGEQAP
jgi:mono/diheme cytochrome c family protein